MKSDVIYTILYLAGLAGAIYLCQPTDHLQEKDWTEQLLQQMRDRGILLPFCWGLGIAVFAIYAKARGKDGSKEWREYFEKLGAVFGWTLCIVIVGCLVFIVLLLLAEMITWIVSLF